VGTQLWVLSLAAIRITGTLRLGPTHDGSSKPTTEIALLDVVHPNSRRPSRRRSRVLHRSERSSSASVDGSSIPSTPQRSNASARQGRGSLRVRVKASIVTTNACATDKLTTREAMMAQRSAPPSERSTTY
jgi:hypothetical protein